MSVKDDIIRIDPAKCVGCDTCAKNCPTGAISGAFREPHSIDYDKCVNCGYCVGFCGVNAISYQSDKERFLAALADPDKKVAVQFSPAVRVAIGEKFGVEPGVDCSGKLTAALKKMGADYVYDTNVGADMTIMEEAKEFLERFNSKDAYKWPMFTSCCPGWVRYVEKKYPAYLDNISTARSPMQMQSPFTKEYHRIIRDEKVISCAVMPCTAKKYEAKREEFRMYEGENATDIVVTTVEMAEMISEAGIDFINLEPVAPDDPFGYGTGGAVIFGVTGGVAEAVVRYVANGILGVSPEDTVKLSGTCGLRGYEFVREAIVKAGGLEIRIAVVHGLNNLPAFLEKVESGELKYDLIEVMACPNGCVGGAGMPKILNPKKRDETKQARGNGLYKADDATELKASNQNPAMDYLYKNVILGREHELLHVHYEH